MRLDPMKSRELTKREIEVWELVAQGYVRKVLAWKLGIHVKTLDVHIRSICKRLDIDRAKSIPSQLTRIWIERFGLGSNSMNSRDGVN